MVRLAQSHRGAPGYGARHCAAGILCAALRPACSGCKKKQPPPLHEVAFQSAALILNSANLHRKYQSEEMMVLCCSRTSNLGVFVCVPVCACTLIYLSAHFLFVEKEPFVPGLLWSITGGRFSYEMLVVRQVSSAPDWGGVRVAMVTHDVTAGGARFTCRCLLERTGLLH